MKKKLALIVSCEHAVNLIPPTYLSLFIPFKNLLESHRGIDFGALEVAIYFKEVFSCDLILAPTSRLLIDYNRSLTNRCFSEITKKLAVQKKQEIITHYYLPYRQKVIDQIEKHLAHGSQVLHCSIHSFTPVLNKIVRTAEIGFLYDPNRPLEKKLAKEWQLELKKQTPKHRIRVNYPYKGINDGFTTSLRKKYAPEEYLGIEIEFNQALTRNERSLTHLKHSLSMSLLNLIALCVDY
ncbi:N-formylglutamate amidohydrolase [Legionella sp.]|uniref:N-formylglutamate amidohydrolase n=1 Tax=Legionella sp. TaxID=459 RepID=UPI003CC308E2